MKSAKLTECWSLCALFPLGEVPRHLVLTFFVLLGLLSSFRLPFLQLSNVALSFFERTVGFWQGRNSLAVSDPWEDYTTGEASAFLFVLSACKPSMPSMFTSRMTTSGR